MSRRIFKNRDTVDSEPFAFQSGLPENLANGALDAEAELDAFAQDGTANGDFSRPGKRQSQAVDPEKILEKAESEAETIVNAARARAAEIEREAYERGLEEGRKTGEIMADQQLQAVLHRYHLCLDKLETVHGLTVHQLQLDMMDMILHTAEKVVKCELQSHPGVILNMVRDAVKSLKERKSLVVFLNEEDHQHVVSMNESSQRKAMGSQIQFESDPNLQRGSFRIETPAGELDALVETQIQQIRQELEQEFG